MKPVTPDANEAVASMARLVLPANEERAIARVTAELPPTPPIPS